MFDLWQRYFKHLRDFCYQEAERLHEDNTLATNSYLKMARNFDFFCNKDEQIFEAKDV